MPIGEQYSIEEWREIVRQRFLPRGQRRAPHATPPPLDLGELSKRQSEEALREEGWSDVETGSPEFRGRCSFGTDCRTPSSLVAHRAVSGTAANWLKTSESYASRYETPGMLFSTSSETSITTTIASRELCAKAPSSSRVSTSARNLLSRRLLLLSSRSRLPFG